MKTSTNDTIVALASGRGKAGVAVIRISGPMAGPILEKLTQAPRPAPRLASRRLFYGVDGEPIDDGLVLWFPSPSSFTGDDVVELQGHGGRAVITGMIDAVCTDGIARMAEPGEFSKRAFHAGKMDLTQAEGLADLIDAETEAQRCQALRQLGGGLFDIYDDWRRRLIESMAYLEATIDFSDQEIPDGLLEKVDADLKELAGELDDHLARAVKGERLRDGFFVSILGAPNVGKSSLLNRLTGRDAAIVSEQAGTTRDALEVHLDLAGLPVVLIDTAGIRETDDVIEAEGVRRARLKGEEADFRLVLLDGGDWSAAVQADADLIGGQGLVVLNKSDLMDGHMIEEALAEGYVCLSCKTGDGFGDLESRLHDEISELADLSGAPGPTRERHRHCLSETKQSLFSALEQSEIELKGEELRQAADALGRLTGRVDVEDLLDVVFSDFCIGK